MGNNVHKIISGVVALTFVMVPQLFVSPVPVFRFLIPAFIVYVVGVLFYNRYYLRKIGVYSFWTWLRMALFLFSWFGLFFVLPNEQIRGVFLIVSLPIIYFLERMAGNVGERITFNELLLTSGAFFVSSFAATHYFLFPNFPSAWFVAAVFAVVTMLVRTFYEFTPLTWGEQWLVSLVMGLLTAELWWVITFLPFHFSVLGMLLMILFYSMWSLYYYDIFEHLTRRKIEFQLSLLVITMVILLFTTRWTIIK